MAHKVAKLQQQFRDAASKVEGNFGVDGHFFKGISIFVNGFTDPSHSVRCWLCHPDNEYVLCARLHHSLLGVDFKLRN